MAIDLNSRISRGSGRRKPGYCARGITGVIALFSLVCAPVAVSAATVSQVPLQLTPQAEPNILYIIDDSGSMNLSFIPDDICGRRTTNRAKSAAYNSIYYDPGITYSPPVDHNGTPLASATFTSARTDGYASSSSTVNLSTSFRPTWSGSTTGCSDSNEFAGNTEPAYYYHYTGSGSGCSGTEAQRRESDNCYVKVVIQASTPTYSGHGRENRSDCTNAPVCTFAEESRNFANWYQYYRTRLMLAKAGTSRAFATLDSRPRIGYGRINKGSGMVDGVSTTTIERGVRPFGGSDRQGFFDWLFKMDSQTYTPLRRSLDAAGQYFCRTDERGPYSTTPGSSGGENLSCRQNYTVLMTDGYWNHDAAATSAARNNTDGTGGPTITSASGSTYTYTARSPFADNRSNTLADVAMYYWKTDLAPFLENNVATSAANPAFWQHMVTFGVGLGVPTAIDPDEAFAAIATGAAINWPDPQVGYTGATNLPPGRSDDLLHAAVNSRGGFFNAQNPEDFAVRLGDTLATIVGRASASTAAIAASSSRLDTETRIYQVKFRSDDWSSQLLAYTIKPDGSLGDVAWDTDQAGLIPSHGSRKIFTWSGASGRPFLWSSLSDGQRALLRGGGTEALGQDRLNWIRGDRSKEGPGGPLRTRSRLLGDIVNSDPVYVAVDNFGYERLPAGTAGRDSYGNYLREKLNRTPMLYVGANDGMLHAFDARTGEEKFAFIPAAVYPNLTHLATPGYEDNHRYFVDGPTYVGDAYFAAQNRWRTILVGTTGAGGRSVFALDVTDPDNFSSSHVLWEFTDPDLGHTIGRPVVARMKNGEWAAIFGNGYGSNNHQAHLFIVNLQTGSLIRKISTNTGTAANTNGLASPVLLADSTRLITHAYAGDRLGNLWKFDLEHTNAGQWKVDFGNSPLFQARNSAGQPQPITAPVEIGRHPEGGYMIYFGTGKFFEVGDNVLGGNPPVQSLYGIWDNESRVEGTDRSRLAEQKILAEVNRHDREWRVVSNHSFEWGSGAQQKRGWFLDLVYPADNPQGERVVSRPLLRHGRAIFTTMIPSRSACDAGGTSWLMELDALSGGRLKISVFDVNDDGTFSEADFITVDGVDVPVPITGLKSTAGIIQTPAVITSDGIEYKYAAGSTGEVSVIREHGGVTGNQGRRSWRQLQ